MFNTVLLQKLRTIDFLFKWCQLNLFHRIGTQSDIVELFDRIIYVDCVYMKFHIQ